MARRRQTAAEVADEIVESISDSDMAMASVGEPVPPAAATPQEEAKAPEEKKTEEKPYDPKELDFEITTEQFLLRVSELNPKIGKRRCIVADGSNSGRRATGAFVHWGPNYSGFVERDKAGMTTVYAAAHYLGAGNYILEVLKEPPLPDGKKCLIEQVFAESFLEMMKSHPENPMVRAHIMKNILKEPPKSLKTYDELKVWIETHYQPEYFNKDAVKKNDGSGFTISHNVTRVESGSCHYNNRQATSREDTWTADDISSLIFDSELSLDRIMARMADNAAEEATDYEDVEGTFHYEEYESDDHSDYEAKPVNSIQVEKERLIEFVRAMLGEEAVEEMMNH